MDWLKYFKKLPPPLLLMLGVAIVAAIYLLRLDPPAVLACVVVLVVCLLVAARLYTYDQRLQSEGKLRRDAEDRSNALLQKIQTGGKHRNSWTRPILQMPLEPAVCESIFQVFEAVLDEARESLRLLHSGSDPRRLRANVFLPTSDGVSHGDVCNLIIPHLAPSAAEGLQLNMQEEDERSLTFRPNQGATGRVFVEGRAVGVLTNSCWLKEKDEAKRKMIDRWNYVRLHPDADLGEPGESLPHQIGKGHFEMTKLQDRVVDARTSWLISMPILLRFDSTLEVVGVLNVDSLGLQLKPEQLRVLYYCIAPFAGVLAGIVRELPTDRVAIVRFTGNDR